MAVDYMGAAWGWACVRDEHLRALHVNIECSRTVNSVSISQTVLHAPSSRHVSRIHTHTHTPSPVLRQFGKNSTEAEPKGFLYCGTYQSL